MKTKKNTVITGQAGIHSVGKIFSSEFEWLFREQPVGDFGIDAHVEVCKNGKPTGRLIGLQIKYGESFFDEKVAQGFIYRGNKAHLEYWTKHSLPVILILCDPSTDTQYWELLSQDKIQTTSKGWKVVVPKIQVLNTTARKTLQGLAEGLPYNRRFADLSLAKPWMQLLGKGHSLFLEAEEWVNKSSGRGSIRLVTEMKGGSSRIELDWPYVSIPFTPYAVLFYKLFPWANFTVDEEFYEECDTTSWDDECGVWDSEDKTYVMHTRSFDEWREDLATIRPYEIEMGEVARFRLQLSMGKLGRAFILIDNYLNSGVPPGVEKATISADYASGLKVLASERGLYPSDDY
jgi:hypothetical protein